MQTYLVGGAVRDGLLNRPVKDKDYVVVGATPEIMKQNGYMQVGKDFPVFLHPHTKEEYALARTERKQGKGYHGFDLYFGKEVTLEDDLLRRDLTINAIAQDTQGKLIDPFGGIQDIKDKILRHVSPAFAEDPLRVLRVARFAARYADLGFIIATETLELMTQLTSSGELATLTAERVWQETERALAEQSAWVYFETLRHCGALAVLFPEIDALFGVPQRKEYHPEVDTGIHTLLSLQQACADNASVEIRYAVLTHDLGKALTPENELPSHKGHEKAGLEPLNDLNKRLKVPKRFEKLANYVCEHHLKCHRISEMTPKSIVKLIAKMDGFRNPDNVINFAKACRYDAQGRTGLENKPYPQTEYLIACLQATKDIRFADIPEPEKTILMSKQADGNNRGDLIANAIYRLRINAVRGLDN